MILAHDSRVRCNPHPCRHSRTAPDCDPRLASESRRPRRQNRRIARSPGRRAKARIGRAGGLSAARRWSISFSHRSAEPAPIPRRSPSRPVRRSWASSSLWADPAAAGDRRGDRVDEAEGNREGCKRTMAGGRKGREMVDRKILTGCDLRRAGAVVRRRGAGRLQVGPARLGRRAPCPGRGAMEGGGEGERRPRDAGAGSGLRQGAGCAAGLCRGAQMVRSRRRARQRQGGARTRCVGDRDDGAGTGRGAQTGPGLAARQEAGSGGESCEAKTGGEKCRETQTRGGGEIGKKKTGGAESRETETRGRQASPADGRAKASRPAVAGGEGVPGLRFLPADGRRPGGPFHDGRRVRGAAPSRDHCAALRGEQI